MTSIDLGSLWVIAGVLAAIVGAGLALLLRERAAGRRHAVLDSYAERQLALHAQRQRPNRARGGSVLPGPRAL